MNRRVLAAATLSTGIFIALAALPLSGQGGTSTAPPLVITAYNGGPPIPYTVPR